MRLTVESDGFSVANQDGDSRELHDIVNVYLPRFLALFSQKNKDYGNGFSNELGIRGQYSDIHRKVGKLRRAMWDGEELEFEGVSEILLDLVGNAFLTMHMLDQNKTQPNKQDRKDKDRDAYLNKMFEQVQDSLLAKNFHLNTRDYNFSPSGQITAKRKADGAPGEATLKIHKAISEHNNRKNELLAHLEKVRAEARDIENQISGLEWLESEWAKPGDEFRFGSGATPEPEPDEGDKNAPWFHLHARVAQALSEARSNGLGGMTEAEAIWFMAQAVANALSEEPPQDGEKLAPTMESSGSVKFVFDRPAPFVGDSDADADTPIGYSLAVEIDGDGMDMAFKHPNKDTHPATAVPELQLSSLIRSAKELYDQARELNQWGNCL
jgi:hypothetical protein